MKFRAKRKYGNEVITGYYNAIDGVHHYIFNNDNLNSPDWFEIDPATLAMETGQPDKNGTMIFGSVPVDGVMSKGADRLICLTPSGENSGNYDYLEFKKGCFWLRHRDIPVIDWTEHSEEWNGQFEITGKQYEL